MPEHDTPSSSKQNFFTTIPGIITGLATLITAITGLFLVLNKSGCVGKNSGDNKTDEVVAEKDQKQNTLTDTTAKLITLTNFNGVAFSASEIKFAQKGITYKIKDAKLEHLPSGKYFLTLTIKCSNESDYEYHYYSKYLVAQIGEDKYPADPNSGSKNYQSITPSGFKDLICNFDLPAGTKDFKLVFYDEKDEIGNTMVSLK